MDLGAKSACIFNFKKNPVTPTDHPEGNDHQIVHTTGVQREMLLHNLFGLLNVCVVYLALLLVIRL